MTARDSPRPGPDAKINPETPDAGDVTSLLVAWSRGDRDALNKLTPIVYSE